MEAAPIVVAAAAAGGGAGAAVAPTERGVVERRRNASTTIGTNGRVATFRAGWPPMTAGGVDWTPEKSRCCSSARK